MGEDCRRLKSKDITYIDNKIFAQFSMPFKLVLDVMMI